MAKAKKAKAKKRGKTNKPPAFPFFGAGDAGYFEWFEMWVWFAQPVPKAKRKALEKLAPKIGALEGTHDYLLWAAAGDIQTQLVEAYGTAKARKRMRDYRKKLEEDEDADPWGGDSDEMLAMGGEQKQFNTDLEAWIATVHETQPILFASRREDAEAGGTRLSAWHRRSLAKFAEVETQVHAVFAKRSLRDDDPRRTVLAVAASFAGDRITAATRAAIATKD